VHHADRCGSTFERPERGTQPEAVLSLAPWLNEAPAVPRLAFDSGLADWKLVVAVLEPESAAADAMLPQVTFDKRIRTVSGLVVHMLSAARWYAAESRVLLWGQFALWRAEVPAARVVEFAVEERWHRLRSWSRRRIR